MKGDSKSLSVANAEVVLFLCQGLLCLPPGADAKPEDRANDAHDTSGPGHRSERRGPDRRQAAERVRRAKRRSEVAPKETDLESLKRQATYALNVAREPRVIASFL